MRALIGNENRSFTGEADVMTTGKNQTTVTVVWMGLAALAVGAFWHGWNLIFGQIPILETVIMVVEETNTAGVITQPAWILTLPFGLSRSWDMLGVAIFVWLGFRFWRWAKAEEKDDLVFGLVVGLVVGLVFGLVFGLVVGLGVGLIFGLGYSFIVGLCWLGLGPGLVMFVVITTPFWLIAGIIATYRAIKNRPRAADWSGVKALLSGTADD